MLDGMSDSIQRSRIENLHSREVDRFMCALYDAVVLKVIANLIRQSRQDDVTMEVKKLFLTDLSNFCVNSRENRR